MVIAPSLCTAVHNNYDSTSIRRSFDCLSHCCVILPASRSHDDLIGGGIKRCFCLTSVCRDGPYIGPKSRRERPRKTKIGTEIAHVTRDSDTTFKVKRLRSPGRFTQRGLLW